jgi:16S rRNA C967 or C1407 C5-methylase (RsmB/RsmF family)/NOL1/NOP2/fmu family ribosome biogenesis protein
MFPEDFRKRIKLQEYIDADVLLRVLEEPSPVSIRINPEKWKHHPVNAEPVPWCKDGFYLNFRPSFTTDPLFHSGCYYPQEASSMFLEQVFMQTIDNKEYIRVLDLCGAPGGKSTHLSALIGDRGFLVANEVIRARAAILSENITKWGFGNTIVSNNDPSEFGNLKGYFDVILIDAPCSGEGMFRDPAAVKEWSSGKTLLCSQRQKRILKDIWPALKEGGILIYSTCTFNPAENEENVRWLTTNETAECLVIDKAQFNDIKDIDYQGITGYGFYPGKIKGEGFFISAIRKTERSKVNKIKNLKNPFRRINKDDLLTANTWTVFSDENLISSGDDIFSVAGNINDYLILSKNIKIIKGGTRICSVKNKKLIPYHELALSTGLRKEAFCKAELDYNQAVSYLRRDSFMLPDAPKGWLIVTYKRVNLGFINNIGSRINNYYPVEWRIRMRLPEMGEEKILNWLADDKSIT